MPCQLRVSRHNRKLRRLLSQYRLIDLVSRLICHNLPMYGRYRLSRRKQVFEEYSPMNQTRIPPPQHCPNPADSLLVSLNLYPVRRCLKLWTQQRQVPPRLTTSVINIEFKRKKPAQKDGDSANAGQTTGMITSPVVEVSLSSSPPSPSPIGALCAAAIFLRADAERVRFHRSERPSDLLQICLREPLPNALFGLPRSGDADGPFRVHRGLLLWRNDFAFLPKPLAQE
jgi:hypothetical protein